MTTIVGLAGVLIALIGLVALVAPQVLLGWIRSFELTPALRGLAFVVRVTIGVALVLTAETTRFPGAMRIGGALFIVSGLAAIVMSTRSVEAMQRWAGARGHTPVRIGGAVSIVLGALLVRVAI